MMGTLQIESPVNYLKHKFWRNFMVLFSGNQPQTPATQLGLVYA